MHHGPRALTRGGVAFPILWLLIGGACSTDATGLAHSGDAGGGMGSQGNADPRTTSDGSGGNGTATSDGATVSDGGADSRAGDDGFEPGMDGAGQGPPPTARPCHDLPFYENAPRTNPEPPADEHWAQEVNVGLDSFAGRDVVNVATVDAVYFLDAVELGPSPSGADVAGPLGSVTGREARMALYADVRGPRWRFFVTARRRTGEIVRAIFGVRSKLLRFNDRIVGERAELTPECLSDQVPFLEAAEAKIEGDYRSLLAIKFIGNDKRWHGLLFRKFELGENLPNNFFSAFP